VEKVEGPGSERTGSRHDGVVGQVGEAGVLALDDELEVGERPR